MKFQMNIKANESAIDKRKNNEICSNELLLMKEKNTFEYFA
jgi:hypothetical protein